MINTVAHIRRREMKEWRIKRQWTIHKSSIAHVGTLFFESVTQNKGTTQIQQMELIKYSI
jgi:hypothetical protein